MIQFVTCMSSKKQILEYFFSLVPKIHIYGQDESPKEGIVSVYLLASWPYEI
jgi:hypothetical protein